MRFQKSEGFTLLEMVLVLGLAALILALVLPRLGGGLDGLRVRTASRQVAALLRSARAQAVSERQVVTVTVNARERVLHVEPLSRAGVLSRLTLPDGIQLAILDEGSRRRSDRAIRIRFSARGGSDGGVLGVSGAGRLIPIAVDPLTGRVTIQ